MHVSSQMCLEDKEEISVDKAIQIRDDVSPGEAPNGKVWSLLQPRAPEAQVVPLSAVFSFSSASSRDASLNEKPLLLMTLPIKGLMFARCSARSLISQISFNSQKEPIGKIWFLTQICRCGNSERTGTDPNVTWRHQGVAELGLGPRPRTLTPGSRPFPPARPAHTLPPCLTPSDNAMLLVQPSPQGKEAVLPSHIYRGKGCGLKTKPPSCPQGAHRPPGRADIRLLNSLALCFASVFSNKNQIAPGHCSELSRGSEENTSLGWRP